ncbi:MAG: peptidase M1 [Ignavibacteriae bacterium]|nr:MAG: peptidase M1 [Ignavibacteriota bacterium]
MKKTLLGILFLTNIIFSQQTQHDCSRGKIEQLKKLNKIFAINYSGDSNIDVTYYKLDLNISYDNQKINGIVTISAISETDNLSSIFLDLQNHFTVDSVKVNNITVNDTLYSDRLHITLDKIYNSNEMIKMEIAYHGTPGNSGFGSFKFSDHNGEKAIWTLSEPFGASDWWPCKDTPADKADSSDVWVTADSFFVSVSNGILTDEIINEDGTKTYKWKNSYPIANYLISLTMTNYKLYKTSFEYETGKFMPVVHYNYPENFNKIRKDDLDKTIDMLTFFSEVYGEYPFIKEKYGHAEFGWGGGMEHQTISSMGSFGESITAHELAHQWFGDKVTCKTWKDIWVNEGFATYSEALYAEHAHGLEKYFEIIATDLEFAKQAVGSIYVNNDKAVDEIFNYYRTYAKGSAVLHMLRKVLNDSTFFNSLKAYLNNPEYAYNVATIRNFQAICEKVSGKDLSYFFDEWLFGENYPKYNLDWSSNKLTDNKFTVSLTLTQTENTNPKFFTMPIDFKIYSSNGDTTVTLFNNQQEQTFKITTKNKPDSVKLDPENWILKSIESFTSLEQEDKKITTEFLLTQNYPNPFNPVTTINYTIPNANVIANEMKKSDKTASRNLFSRNYASKVTLKVYDVLGREIKTLVNKIQNPGNYSIKFNAANLPSAIYFYRLQADNFVTTKKMILLK